MILSVLLPLDTSVWYSKFVYITDEYVDSKIKREKEEIPVIKLIKNPDIAAALGAMKAPSQKLVGFALETNNEESNALDKLHRKNLDMIVLNSLQDSGACFGTDTNKITTYFSNGEKLEFPLKSKVEVAKDIIDYAEYKYY